MDLEHLRVNPAIEQQQKTKLVELRASRDQVKVNDLLGHLETAAKSTENLMPLLVTCVENEITLGEICGVLRKVWGEYQPPVWG